MPLLCRSSRKLEPGPKAYGKASESIGELILPSATKSLLNAAAEGLARTFTPPNTPAKARRTAGPPTALPIVSSGRVDLFAALPTPSPKKLVLSPTKTITNPYYIVYHGRGGMQGIFDSWKSRADDYGPDCLCDSYKHRLSKKFSDANKARMYYDECLESGVLDVLRDEPSSDEVLFVIKGALPGVYTKRLAFLIKGLVWRGSVVMAGNGTRAQGDAQFRQWKAAGHIEVFPANGPRRHF
ncbi:hypothetical protein BT96DRAFT_995206 [Gymnopus androsaceus JB14]|uniref:Uncharacterized protein n=1 Tax=Gymnopus androsaceus JB14 TaxID=1447944 RepID=A0A6A4HJY8_9AGAR|nr:hypothetical protein BT96DRAFT_995206 [Gymnopus androsaceus JB14]